MPGTEELNSICQHRSLQTTGRRQTSLKYAEEKSPYTSLNAQVTPLPGLIMNKRRLCELWVADLEFTLQSSQVLKTGGWLQWLKKKKKDHKQSKKSLCFVWSDFTQPWLHANALDSTLLPVHVFGWWGLTHWFVCTRIPDGPSEVAVRIPICAPAKQIRTFIQTALPRAPFIAEACKLKMTSLNS